MWQDVGQAEYQITRSRVLFAVAARSGQTQNIARPGQADEEQALLFLGVSVGGASHHACGRGAWLPHLLHREHAATQAREVDRSELQAFAGVHREQTDCVDALGPGGYLAQLFLLSELLQPANMPQ